MVHLDPNATVRPSRRGLVVAGATGESALFEHPRAASLPALVEDDPPVDVLAARLGPPLDPGVLPELVSMRVLADEPRAVAPVDRVRLTRTGLLIGGFGRPAAAIDRGLVAVSTSRIGSGAAITALAAVLVLGGVALTAGRPNVPLVSPTPGVEVLLMMAVVIVGGALHELGHAVAMAHYGVVPRRGGIGFYWGALSFFVDSSPAMTLPRRQRVVQALAGLGVDVVVVCVLAIVAHSAAGVLVPIVAWRMAVLELVAVLLNVLPFLELDGHWALADALDEPDLSARSRRALGSVLRRRTGWDGFAVYGLVSLVGGVALLGVSALVFWRNAGHLVVALLTGDPGSVVLGVWYVLPVLVGLVFSALGLMLETVASGA